jgi:hypothetical protein
MYYSHYIIPSYIVNNEHSLISLLLHCPCLFCHSFLWWYLVILSESVSVQVFYRLFIYVLPLPIQLSRGEIWDSINRSNPTPYVFLSLDYTCISNVICRRPFLCSVNWGERWLFVLLILGEYLRFLFIMLTIITMTHILASHSFIKYVLSWHKFEMETSPLSI